MRKFIFDDLMTVEGYIDPPDALVFHALLSAQTRDRLIGGIAEIGVFYGRTYFLFRKIGGDSEKILAIDLFELNQDMGENATQYGRFIENGRRLGLRIDEDLILKNDSASVQPADILERIGNARFFSIDGGHMLSHVATDAALASDTLCEHGVIAFDDTFNPAWPEVTVAVGDFLRDRQETFSAFCLTKYRTYVCRKHFHAYYRKVVSQAPELRSFDAMETNFLGSSTVRLHDPIKRRILHGLLAGAGMKAFSGRAYG